MYSPKRDANKDTVMEFELSRDMFGKVTGKGGATVKGISECSGARCYVHKADDDDPRTFMEAKGTLPQIEKACEELIRVVDKIDSNFAARMEATVTMRLKAGEVKGLKGKGKRETEKIEKKTGARIRTEAQKKVDGSCCVRIVGPIREVDMASDMVQELMDSLDDLSLNEESLRSHPIFSVRQTEGRLESKQTSKNEKWQSRAAPEKKSRPQHQDPSNLVDLQELLKKMPTKVTIEAQSSAFKCLMGKKGSLFKKITSDCEAEITVQSREEVREDLQHAYISGRFDDVIIGMEKVKGPLASYDPKRDRESKGKKENLFRSMEDPKEITAEAFVKIINDAAGLLIGKGGSNVKSIEEKTKASVHVDKEIDDEGCKTVEISGEVNAVLSALDEVKKSMRPYKPQRTRPKTHSPRSPTPLPARKRHSMPRGLRRD